MINFRRLIQSLTNQLEGNKYDLIIGLSRGGLVPAVFLSHRLNVPMVVADISHELSVGDNKDSHSNILPIIPDNVKSILIVDDIIDSGNTIIALITNLKTTASITVSALYIKDGAEEHLRNSLADTLHHGNVTGYIGAQHLPIDSPFVYFPWEIAPTG
jgi:hypoxanthine phosphoribosyltransferase